MKKCGNLPDPARGAGKEKEDGLTQPPLIIPVPRPAPRSRLFYAGCFLLLLAVETGIALYVRDRFVRPFVGDILVVILLYCFARIAIARPVRWLPAAIFLFACGIEGLQYLQLADRLGLQHNTAARILLGSVFDWKDILCYGAGCLLLTGVRR